MALTASATKLVQEDIIISLDMRLDRLYRVVHCMYEELWSGNIAEIYHSL